MAQELSDGPCELLLRKGIKLILDYFLHDATNHIVDFAAWRWVQAIILVVEHSLAIWVVCYDLARLYLPQLRLNILYCVIVGVISHYSGKFRHIDQMLIRVIHGAIVKLCLTDELVKLFLDHLVMFEVDLAHLAEALIMLTQVVQGVVTSLDFICLVN